MKIKRKRGRDWSKFKKTCHLGTLKINLKVCITYLVNLSSKTNCSAS